jgi:hypothetical protein
VYGLARLAWTIMSRGLDIKLKETVGFDEETIRGAIDENDLKVSDSIWKKLRPYVASSGLRHFNPLYMGALRAANSSYVEDDYLPWNGQPTSPSGKRVYSLASFEYMRENGLHSVIDEDLKKEWKVYIGQNSHCGMMTGSYAKLHNNKDFAKFQSSLLKELY